MTRARARVQRMKSSGARGHGEKIRSDARRDPLHAGGEKRAALTTRGASPSSRVPTRHLLAPAVRIDASARDLISFGSLKIVAGYAPAPGASAPVRPDHPPLRAAPVLAPPGPATNNAFLSCLIAVAVRCERDRRATAVRDAQPLLCRDLRPRRPLPGVRRARSLHQGTKSRASSSLSAYRMLVHCSAPLRRRHTRTARCAPSIRLLV